MCHRVNITGILLKCVLKICLVGFVDTLTEHKVVHLLTVDVTAWLDL